MSSKLPCLAAKNDSEQELYLDEFITSSITERDVMIVDIWTILQGFAFKHKYRNIELPSFLRADNDQYFFVSENTTKSFNRKSLIRFLFKTLRRLFEACCPEELPKMPWLADRPKGIIQCVLKMSPNYSETLYVLCGLPCVNTKTLYPSCCKKDLESIVSVFEKRFLWSGKQSINDLSLAEVLCQFGVQYENLLWRVAEFLIHNAQRRPSIDWPFLGAFVRLRHFRYSSSLEDEKKDFGRLINDQLKSDTKGFGREQLDFLTSTFPFFETCSTLDADVFLSLPRPLVEKFQSDWLCLFFDCFSDVKMEPKHLDWLVSITGDQNWRDPIARSLLALSYFGKGVCSARFVEVSLCKLEDSNWGPIINHPQFNQFLERGALFPHHGRYPANEFIKRVSESQSLFQQIVNSGALNCVQKRDLSYPKDVVVLFVLQAMEVTTNMNLLNHILRKISMGNVLDQWPHERAFSLYCKHINDIEKDTIEIVFDRSCPSHYIILASFLDSNTDKKRYSYPIPLRSIKKDAAWLQELSSSSLQAQLTKQIILGKISFDTITLYALEIGKMDPLLKDANADAKLDKFVKLYRPYDLDKTLLSYGIDALCYQIIQLSLSSENDIGRAFSSAHRKCSEKLVPSSDLVIELSRLPVSTFKKIPYLVAVFLLAFLRNPQPISVDNTWVHDIAKLAGTSIPDIERCAPYYAY